jgi:hypothetical protein
MKIPPVRGIASPFHGATTQEKEKVMNESAQVIPHPSQSLPTLTSNAAKIDEIKSQVNLIQHVMREVMREDEHFGVIPGCGDKPALLKPGAEKLMLTFRLANDLEIETVDLPGLHREYRVKVTIYAPNGQRLGTGVGSCSTMESKYRFRTGPVEDTGRPVPKAYWENRESNPGRAQSLIGGKGYSVKKIDGVWKIVQQGEKVEFDNPADNYNTCLKMAKKRALVDAVLTSTAASDLFTQDIDEDPELYGDVRKPGSVATEGQTHPGVSETGNPESPSASGQPAEPLSPDEICGYLAAKNIRHEHGEDGTIFVFPDYSDTSARNWLKEQGFKWDSKGRRWYL